jgi:hypothetical protein
MFLSLIDISIYYCTPKPEGIAIIVIIKWFVSHVKSFQSKELQMQNCHVSMSERTTVQFSF